MESKLQSENADLTQAARIMADQTRRFLLAGGDIRGALDTLRREMERSSRDIWDGNRAEPSNESELYALNALTWFTLTLAACITSGNWPSSKRK